ncbi:hypothetical protein OQA88_7407 [Cercophora sp. LCS_1]
MSDQFVCDWEQLKPEIRRLYLVNNKSLAEVVKVLGATRQVHITQAQLEFKLKQWQFRKNMPPQAWRYVAQEIRKRKTDEKDSEVVYCGVVLLEKKVKKALARYGLASTEDRHMPWLSFKEELEHLLDSCAEEKLDGPIIELILTHEDTPGTPTNLWNGISSAFTGIQELMPNRPIGERSRQSDVLCQQGFNAAEMLELLLFLLSNNSPELAYWSQNLDCFALSLLKRTRRNPPLWPSVTSFDPNQPMALKYLTFRPMPTFQPFGPPSMPIETALPLEMAVYARNRELADLLLSHHANWSDAMARVSLVKFATFGHRANHQSTAVFLAEVLAQRSQNVTGEEWDQATKHMTLRGDTESVKLLLGFYRNNMLTVECLRPEALAYAIRNRLDGMVELLVDAGCDVNALARSKLWEAVFIRSADICRLLFRHGALPQHERYDISTPLQCAAYMGNSELVQLLLSNGADINHVNLSETSQALFPWGSAWKMQVGRTSPEAALYGKQPQVAFILLESGADIMGSELMIAIRTRMTPLIEQLLDAGPPLANQSDNVESALEAAITTNQLEVAHTILAMRPELYEPSALCAATHMAVMSGDLSMIEILLERRDLFALGSDQADLAQTELEGTALAISAYFGSLPIIDLLISHDITSPTCLLPSAMSLVTPHSVMHHELGEQDQAPLDVWGQESGWWRGGPDADANLVTASPLEAAVAGGDQDTLSLMLGLGYRPDTGSLTTAARAGYLEGLEMLLACSTCGLETAERSLDLRAALHAGIGGRHVQIVQRLLQAGVDINAELPAPDETLTNCIYFQGSAHLFRPRTALQAAVGTGCAELVKLLLDHGADPHASPVPNGGATALQLAAIQGLLSMVKNLLDIGVGCNEEASGPQGRTALEGAAEHGRLDMVQFLLSRGVETTGGFRRQYIRAIAAWDEVDHQLFCDELGESRSPDSHLNSQHQPFTLPETWKGKEKDTTNPWGLPTVDNLQEAHESVESYDPWDLYAMTDDSWMPALMEDWSTEWDGSGSSSSGPSGRIASEEGGVEGYQAIMGKATAIRHGNVIGVEGAGLGDDDLLDQFLLQEMFDF